MSETRKIAAILVADVARYSLDRATNESITLRNSRLRLARRFVRFPESLLRSARTRMTAAFTLRLDDATRKAFDRLAEKTDRSRSWHAARVIGDYIALDAWQIAKIEAAIGGAERGDLADDQDVARVLGKYSAHD